MEVAESFPNLLLKIETIYKGIRTTTKRSTIRNIKIPKGLVVVFTSAIQGFEPELGGYPWLYHYISSTNEVILNGFV